ncbi:MAG: hypothetical protein HY964_04475 [Ignavibacteriales bacterium]|nr:hypothetical protein [Ignavibacteriales bacterium]
MKQLIFAAIAGGILLFVWGWLAWTIVPVHDGTLHSIENEEAVVTAMNVNMDKKGVYVFPAMPASHDPVAVEEYNQKYQAGPVGMIIYDPHGGDPMSATQMIIGIIISILSAFLAAWFLSRSTAAASNYFGRVIYIGMLGIFITLFSHIVNWNWMNYPLDYTTGWSLDTIIGWIFAGLGIAAIIKTRKISEA